MQQSRMLRLQLEAFGLEFQMNRTGYSSVLQPGAENKPDPYFEDLDGTSGGELRVLMASGLHLSTLCDISHIVADPLHRMVNSQSHGEERRQSRFAFWTFYCSICRKRKKCIKK